MKTKIYLFVLICVFISLPSCEDENSELLSSTEEIAEIKSVLIDSLETVLPLEETEELKAFKKQIEELAKTQLRSTSSLAMSDDYDENFSSNMYAIRELPLTFQARGQANTSNRYLSANGKGKEITLNATGNQKAQKFYVKVLPATSGIPYLIYSSQTDTPLSVGQNSSNPNRKVLFAQNDASGSLFSASWDLLSSASYKGYFAIQSQSYLGQSDPNNMWSVFNYVLEVQNDNKLGYAQYTKKAQQEFLLKPDDKFILKEIVFDKNLATVTEQVNNPLVITTYGTNPSEENKEFTLKSVYNTNETSTFSEKSQLVIDLSSKTGKLRRPSVLAGKFIPPPTLEPNEEPDPSIAKPDATYRSLYEKIPKTLAFDINGWAKPNSLIEATSYLKYYSVTAPYSATLIIEEDPNRPNIKGREIKVKGTWSGTIYTITRAKADVIKCFDLDDGEELLRVRRNIQLSTITFK